MSDKARYVHALSFRFLTPLYDPLMRVGMRELTFKRRLIEEAHLAPGYRVLDVGCGTGTLAVLIKETHPGAEVVGLDGDGQVLDIARKKAASQGLDIRFDLGMASQLPYPDHSFDRVLSSLMIHHLTTEQKRRTFAEVFRVCKPGGELLVVDFGKPNNLAATAISQVMRRLERTEDNVRGRLPGMMRDAGFADVYRVEGWNSIFGIIDLFRAKRS